MTQTDPETCEDRAYACCEGRAFAPASCLTNGEPIRLEIAAVALRGLPGLSAVGAESLGGRLNGITATLTDGRRLSIVDAYMMGGQSGYYVGVDGTDEEHHAPSLASLIVHVRDLAASAPGRPLVFCRGFSAADKRTEIACDVCGAADRPIVTVDHFSEPMHAHRVCVPCVRRALDEAGESES